jgi:Flp pilus assembly protein TadD
MTALVDSARTDEERLARLAGYLGSDPGNSRLMAEVIDLSLSLGDRSRATETLKAALERYPDDPGFVFRRANLAIVERRLDDAEQALRQLCGAKPVDLAVHHNLAYVMVLQGRPGDAAALLEPAATGEAASVESTTLLVHALHHAGRTAEAIDRARQALQHWPEDSQLLAVASLALWDGAESTDAQKLAERSLAIDPDVVAALATCGSVALEHGDPEAAGRYFRRAVAVNESDGRSWSGLGLSSLMLERIDDALCELERAVELMPGHIGTWHALGWCRLAAGRREQARAAFQSALDLDRNVADSHGALGVMAAMEGRDAEARASINRAFALDRNCLSAGYARALLLGEARNAGSLAQVAKRLLAGRGDAESLLRRVNRVSD